MKKIKKYMIGTAFAGLCLCASPSKAEPVIVEQLFEYIAAPDTMQSLQSRSNYVVKNFWNPMDLKSKKPVDQNALNHAFDVYRVPLQYAEANVAMKATDDLLKKLSKNPVLLLQFVKAAEETMYGPRALVWIDDIYIKYLEALTANKKIPELRKIRYADQLVRLHNSHIGVTAPRFEFTDRQGDRKEYRPMSTFTIIEFGDPACVDCRMAKLRLDTNSDITRLVEEGRLNILFITPQDVSGDKDWLDQTEGYPEKWAVGASPDVEDIYDLRSTPSIYVVDGHGKIVAKNISADQAIAITLENLNK